MQDKQKDKIVQNYSELRYNSQRRFGYILRELCETSGFTQGKLAREAKAERQRLIEEGYINPGDFIGSMEQSAISRVMAGTQEPTYFQVLIWLKVVRKHYESPELAQACQKIQVEKPEFSRDLERKLWILAAFVPPKELSQTYEESKTIEPMKLRKSMIIHKEKRMIPKRDMTDYVLDNDVPTLRKLAHVKNNTEEILSSETE
jgi:transcriptional regulator with XRE-family HTH domain